MLRCTQLTTLIPHSPLTRTGPGVILDIMEHQTIIKQFRQPLMDILSDSLAGEDDSGVGVTLGTLAVILRLTMLLPEFRQETLLDNRFETIIFTTLLKTDNHIIRQQTADLLIEISDTECQMWLDSNKESLVTSLPPLTDFLTTLMWELLSEAALHPSQSYSSFCVMVHLVRLGHRIAPQAVDLKRIGLLGAKLLSQHEPLRQVDEVDLFDPFASGLAHLLLSRNILEDDGPSLDCLPESLPETILDQLLFPSGNTVNEGAQPRAILDTRTRGNLGEIIIQQIRQDPRQLVKVLQKLDQLLPHHEHDGTYIATLRASSFANNLIQMIHTCTLYPSTLIVHKRFVRLVGMSASETCRIRAI